LYSGLSLFFKYVPTLLIGLCLLGCTCAYAGATGQGDVDLSAAEVVAGQASTTIRSSTSFDILYQFNDTEAGFYGVETDGTHIYTSAWNASPQVFHQFSMDGTFIQQLSITGVSNIRDMAYDGTYFYGSNNTMTIYKMDIANETNVGTITAGCNGISGIRHISYDPTLDEGNGGFWIGGWDSLGAIKMDGGEIYSAIPAIGITSIAGSAYDPWSAGGPYLWLFDQDGSAKLHQFDIATKTLTGVTIDCTTVTGFDSGVAGGAASYHTGTTAVLLADIQQSPNLIVAYDLNPPDPPEASYTYTPFAPCIGDAVTFDASASSVPDGTISTYEWDWESDGTYDATGVTQTHTFTTGGTHSVTLRVTDNQGAKDTEKKDIFVSPNIPPVATFTHSPQQPSIGISVSFDASSSTDTDGTIVRYEWDWESDGTYDAEGENATHAYLVAGTHLVTLRVTDNKDAQDTQQKGVTVEVQDTSTYFSLFLLNKIAYASELQASIALSLSEGVSDEVCTLLDEAGDFMREAVSPSDVMRTTSALQSAIRVLEEVQSML